MTVISMVKTTYQKALAQPNKIHPLSINFLLRDTENKQIDTHLQVIHSKAQLNWGRFSVCKIWKEKFQNHWFNRRRSTYLMPPTSPFQFTSRHSVNKEIQEWIYFQEFTWVSCVLEYSRYVTLSPLVLGVVFLLGFFFKVRFMEFFSLCFCTWWRHISDI